MAAIAIGLFLEIIVEFPHYLRFQEDAEGLYIWEVYRV